MTRRVPFALVAVRSLRAWEKGLLIDTGVSRLIEGRDTQLLVGVLLDDTESVVVSVE